MLWLSEQKETQLPNTKWIGVGFHANPLDSTQTKSPSLGEQ
jgi:hypothetical protein